ncbi:MAG: 5-(carboxyamino)imidazole ribonucleotide synthase [Bacteroidota bacterium]|nr:5-(carboxyamino)imidazole ribonucleotide synthase [Bacteroidota bacterium]
MNTTIGILGGGQLGRMLFQQAANYPVNLTFLDKDINGPCGSICPDVVEGDPMNYEDVLAFGRSCDLVSIEIEAVNTEALRQLQEEGIQVIPSPDAIETIRDKGLQKQCYSKHSIATMPYQLIDSEKPKDFPFEMPFVQKLRQGGYDGKGVQVFRTEVDLKAWFTEPSLLEEAAKIQTEIAVIVGRSPSGQSIALPECEMVFDPVYNLVSHLQMPSSLDRTIQEEAKQLAIQVAEALDSPGIFAVEMFLLEDGRLVVNETAPRTHNSGHATIESLSLSQFDLHLRVLLDLSLPDVRINAPAIMVNVIGSGKAGKAKITGLDDLSALPDVYLHWYGKILSKPGRKMGHVTILNPHNASEIVDTVLNTIQVAGE